MKRTEQDLDAQIASKEPQRSMWSDEIASPRLLLAYLAAVLLGAFLPALIARFA